MFAYPRTVRATVNCPSCKADNDLTINNVMEDQVVACSHCGGRLGTLDDIVRAGEVRDAEIVRAQPESR